MRVNPNSLLAVLVGFTLNLGFSSAAQAAVIDFESIPGIGTPTEGLVISNQFEATEGVTFSLEGGGNPRIAKVGNPMTAFEGPGGAGDTPVPNQGIGTFFLTDNGTISGLVAPPLIVSYTTPTNAASGVILDIDFDENFLIQARDGSGTILESISIIAGDPGTGDGVATLWSFSRPLADITSIRFAGTRTLSGGFGLGFDNFDARIAPVPEPETYAFMLVGLGLVGWAAWRRMHHN